MRHDPFYPRLALLALLLVLGAYAAAERLAPRALPPYVAAALFAAPAATPSPPAPTPGGLAR